MSVAAKRATGSDGQAVQVRTTSRTMPGDELSLLVTFKEMTMARTGLLKAACTVAMLAAAPAFAQSNAQPGSTGAGGTANNPTAHETMPMMSGSDNMSSGGKSMGSHAGMGGHSHHRAMMGRDGAMHDKMSQDAAVDQLNDRSYQAARSGQAYSGGGTSGGMMMPGGSAGKDDMSGGAMSNNGSSNNGSK